MRTLDRYIVRNFLTSALLWFVVFMALRTITDLFVNMDEFAKLDKPFGEKIAVIAQYYGYQSLVYFVELGGIIIVVAATFSLAMMNHTNELTAMLASGVSLHRVAWPIILCAMLMGGLIIFDQEVLIPQFADKLVRPRDDPFGTDKFPIRLMADGTGAVWYSNEFLPETETAKNPVVLVRDSDYRLLVRLSGSQGRPGTVDGQRGWLLSDGVIAPREGTWPNIPGVLPPQRKKRDTDPEPSKYIPVYMTKTLDKLIGELCEDYRRRKGKEVDPNGKISVEGLYVNDEMYGMLIEADRFEAAPAVPDEARTGKLIQPKFTFKTETGRMLGVFRAESATWKPRLKENDPESHWALDGGVLFYPTDLTTYDLQLRQSSRWLQYMSMADLGRLLRLKRVPDPDTARLVQHIRIADPINSLVMLLLGLPFILSRERNLKASATLCVLMVGTFYAFIYICRYINLPHTLAAALPILLFGPIAAVMFDSVKT